MTRVPVAPLSASCHGVGADTSQTGAPKPDSVIAVGGGFIPTLSMGGGAGFSGLARCGWEAGS